MCKHTGEEVPKIRVFDADFFALLEVLVLQVFHTCACVLCLPIEITVSNRSLLGVGLVYSRKRT